MSHKMERDSNPWYDNYDMQQPVLCPWPVRYIDSHYPFSSTASGVPTMADAERQVQVIVRKGPLFNRVVC
jgi:hypothetical protein